MSLQEILTDGPCGVVRVLLEKMPEEPAKDKRYGLLLHMAAALGDFEFVKLLIQRGVDLDATGYYYGSALQAAARSGHLKVAEILLDAGININIIGGKHGTAVRAAVTGEHFQLLELLVKQGADLNLEVDKPSTSILQLAIKHRNRDIFQYLLENGADVHNASNEEESCVISACAVKDVEMVIMLIRKGADLNAASRPEAISTVFESAVSPLHVACYTGVIELVQILIKNGAEMNNKTENYGTPLQVASVHGHWPVAQLLLQCGASFDSVVFVEAACNGRISVVQGLLRDRTFDVDLMLNAMGAACWAQQLDCFKSLFEELLSTEEVDKGVLYRAEVAACKAHNDKALQYLLDFDPSPSTSIFSAAIAAGLTKSIKFLIDRGIDPTKRDDCGNFPLHVAAYYQRLNIVNALLEAGADPNAKGDENRDAIRSALEGRLAYQLSDVHIRGHIIIVHLMVDDAEQNHIDSEMKYASVLSQNPIYTVQDWIEESKMSLKQPTDCSKLIQTLIDHFAWPDSSTGFFGNHLHLAAYLGIGDWPQKFVRMGVDVNYNCGYLETPLLAALLGDQISIAEFLIDSGANVNYKSKELGTALYIACRKSGDCSAERMQDIVCSLLHHGAKLYNEVGESHNALNAALKAPRRTVSYNGTTTADLIVEMLLSRCPDLRITGENLVAAVTRDSDRRVRKPFLNLLLEHDQLIQVPEAAILTALSLHIEGKEQLIKQLLGCYQNGVISEEMLKMAPSVSALKLLLQHPNVCPISLALIQDALCKKDGVQRLAVFLDHSDELSFVVGRWYRRSQRDRSWRTVKPARGWPVRTTQKSQRRRGRRSRLGV